MKLFAIKGKHCPIFGVQAFNLIWNSTPRFWGGMVTIWLPYIGPYVRFGPALVLSMFDDGSPEDDAAPGCRIASWEWPSSFRHVRSPNWRGM